MTTSVSSSPAPVSRGAAAAPPPAATRHETVLDLLTQSKRGIVPIAKTFVQQGHGKSTAPGPLHQFVSSHDDRGLEAYLIVHALASAEPWNCDYPAGTWVRALGLTGAAELASAKSAVSKVMKRLDDRGLVVRKRTGRTSSITLLREDGSGEAYDHPLNRDDRWLQLPHAYWTERHYETLSLPGKALLLVALSRPDDFPLPYERGRDWYGISADSTERGLKELCNAGLLRYRQDWVKNQRSDTGWIEQRLYTLQGPYSTANRKKAAKGTRAGAQSDKDLET